MRGNGSKTNSTARVSSGRRKATFTLGSGRTTMPTDLASTSTGMESSTRDSGKWTSSMELARRCGRTAPILSESTKTA